MHFTCIVENYILNDGPIICGEMINFLAVKCWLYKPCDRIYLSCYFHKIMNLY